MVITENSFGVKIYEAMSIGDESIDVNIDISDIILPNSQNKDYIINIVSLELRFDKKLNFYNARTFEKPIQIKINEEITFDGKDLFYELDYSRPNNISEMCILLPTYVSSDCEVYMIYSNLKEDYIYLLGGVIEYFPFECASDGAYSINIKSLSEEESVQGNFTIISTGIPFDLDFTKYIYFYFYSTFNYQPSPLILNIDSSKLDIYFLTYFYHENMEIIIKDENYNNLTFNNDFYFFEPEKNYQIIIKYLKPEEDEYLDYNLDFEAVENNFEELSFGTKNYSRHVQFTLLKISYKNTPKIIFETTQEKITFLIAYISESNYLKGHNSRPSITMQGHFFREGTILIFAL